jgi:hypothetical protein
LLEVCLLLHAAASGRILIALPLLGLNGFLMILWAVIEDRESAFENGFFIERRLVGFEARLRDVNRIKSSTQLVLGAQGGSIIQR